MHRTFAAFTPIVVVAASITPSNHCFHIYVLDPFSWLRLAAVQWFFFATYKKVIYSCYFASRQVLMGVTHVKSCARRFIGTVTCRRRQCWYPSRISLAWAADTVTYFKFQTHQRSAFRSALESLADLPGQGQYCSSSSRVFIIKTIRLSLSDFPATPLWLRTWTAFLSLLCPSCSALNLSFFARSSSQVRVIPGREKRLLTTNLNSKRGKALLLADRVDSLLLLQFVLTNEDSLCQMLLESAGSASVGYCVPPQSWKRRTR